MKGTSKVIMGATLVMVVTLAVVLVLIFVLLAELYCSLLLRRRHLGNNNSNNTLPTATTQPTTARANASPSHTTSHPQQQSPPFSSIYAQGVLQAPRSILLPAISCKENRAGQRKQNHYSELHQVLQIQIQPQQSNSNASPSPPPSFISIAPSKPSPLPGSTIGNLCQNDKPSSGGEGEQLVYISNPIYENDESQVSGANTPFETPDTSPSRLERSGSSEEDEETPSVTHSTPCTPPLTPMKKLPAEACSVSLRDARSLGTSCSDSRSNNGLSSSSGSPCTSPSW